ncbi:MAG: AgmX/PglI C-terminal domain-containing protein [Myxococcota bacterium]|nr:AgmX/PglI C-terminal domain-containing protein [Myxococcota bacterium]
MKRVMMVIGVFVIAFFVRSFVWEDPVSDNQNPVSGKSAEPLAKNIDAHKERPKVVSRKKDRPLFKKISPKRVARTLEPEEVDESDESENERPDQMVYSIDREGIDDAIRAFLPNIRNCYSQARVENPEMEGRIMASFTIEKNTDDPENADIAKISAVEIIESAFEHEDFENCIMDNLDMLWFEPPEEGERTVQYPFLFSY